MELVRAAALTGYFATAEEFGLNVAPLLRRAGISRAMLRNPEQPIPAQAAFSLLEDSAQASGCLAFGLRMVEHRRLGDIGLLSVLFAHQPTLGDALSLLEKYRTRLNPVLFYQQHHGDGTILLSAKFFVHVPAPARQAGDIAIAVLHQAFQSIFLSSWRPIRVGFSYARPPDADQAIYGRLFSCPVEFDSMTEGILISASDLEAPNLHSDPAMALHAQTLLEAMVDPKERTMAEEVTATALLLMPARRASITASADALGISTRTLQRRLEAEGTHFSEVLDRIRRTEAIRYLVDPNAKMSDVAERLGFSTPTSFSRWHRGQFGEPPSASRRTRWIA